MVDEIRPQAGVALPSVGRATRHALANGPGELWGLPEADRGAARRLASLGDRGVAGFRGFGEDREGIFLVRRVPNLTIESLAKGERLEGAAALSKVLDLARALAACEEAAIFPGPLRPAEIALGSAGRPDAFILAETFVRALVGDGASHGSTAPSPRWTPPEQAAGTPWDNAANRYVLGLAAYRLLAGAHPFSGVGLRDAMNAQALEPPPFEEVVARTLQPGIQSLVLALIAAAPSARPPSARAIVARCEALLAGDDASARRDPPARIDAPARIDPRATLGRSAMPAAPAVPAATRGPSAPRLDRRRLLGAIPIALGVVALAIGVVSRAAAPAPPEPRAEAGTLVRRPLAATTAETCAPCHARQVAEWERSIMAHSVKSPLFGALESVVEEQVGREDRCPNGAGILRKASGDVCRDERTGLSVTGAGGEHWCVNCHSAGDNLRSTVPAWSANGTRGGRERKPLRDVLSAQAMEGISCAVCHQTIGPVTSRGGLAYEGNPTWTSPFTGAVFRMRPEDGSGLRGIANSGYALDPGSFLTSSLGRGGPGDPIVHKRASADAAHYLETSEFCGACHDVRLFGADSVGAPSRGEHFKRLRNAYSEWRTWADGERAAGRKAATCQDCHMSLYPGICVQDAGAREAGAPRLARDPDRHGCPSGTHFEARAPGEKARGLVAASSPSLAPVTSHYFTSVDLPLANEFPDAWGAESSIDANGLPIGLEARREQLLRHTFRFAVGAGSRVGGRIEIPLTIENVGAGHRVPAGFSQERETWVELTVTDARGATVYEVGKIERDDADLHDKAFVRVTTREDVRDFKGRPLGMFGADVVDGPDLPLWEPNPAFGGTTFRGKGLVNLQNGFLRCVKCIGTVDVEGRCQPGPGQGRTRADRFDDGAYDLDTGECRSNLVGRNALFETYFPVGSLDADRGIAKAPDAIIDTRSAPPGTVLRYTYVLDAGAHPAPFKVKSRLRFRPFPPFLLRAFADYEARKAAQGERPSGPQLTAGVLRRNHPVDLAEASATID